ncbi:MAG: nucleotide exchange factor GrpE [Candidatus Dadabacteria bacterium]|nr:MAG: nucleotide exchange factor GrpE [Candidatus Dadabacteria bacterium]
MAEERDEERQEAAPATESEAECPAEAQAGEASGEGEDRLAQVTAELEDTKKKLLYLAAEFENYKKRTERRVQEAAEFGCEALLKDLLPVLDNLERAVEHAEQAGAEGFEGLLEGLGHVIQQFHDVLGRHGVEPVPGQGEAFDPYVHEAMAQVEGEEHGKVHQVFEKGYRLKGRLLRPAKVVVTKVAPPQGDG